MVPIPGCVAKELKLEGSRMLIPLFSGVECCCLVTFWSVSGRFLVPLVFVVVRRGDDDPRRVGGMGVQPPEALTHEEHERLTSMGEHVRWIIDT